MLSIQVGCTTPEVENTPATEDVTSQTTTQTNTEEVPNQSNYYEIRTNLGRIVIRLYDDTPEHRDNFARLVSEQFYDSTSFHRVIADFMIQGGDPNSKNDDPMDDGQGGPGYTLPAELKTNHFHKKGALAAARQGDAVNPTRASSGSQFYLVLGSQVEPGTLDQIEQSLRQQIPNPEFAFSEEARTAYTTSGGTPHLDGQYTVFGEVVDGFDVLATIGASPTARATGQAVHPALIDQPFEKVVMQVTKLDDYSPPSN